MNKLHTSGYWWAVLLVILVAVNFLAGYAHFRIDLTQDKRYTLSEPTRRLLKRLPEKVEVTVLLEGNMPAGFKKLRNGIQELLQEFKEIAKTDLQFKFVKPSADSTGLLSADSLMKLGLKPTNVHVQAKQGESEEE